MPLTKSIGTRRPDGNVFRILVPKLVPVTEAVNFLSPQFDFQRNVLYSFISF